jgi:HEAT repeat protein
LSRLPDGVGIPAMIDLARNAPTVRARGKAVFWLGQSGDDRGRRAVRAIAGDAKLPDEMREKAVFALGQSEGATAEDFNFLRELFGRVDSEKLRDQILMAMSQGDDDVGRKWLLTVARDENQSVEARKKAIFWAGQAQNTPTADIASVYDAAKNEIVKEHTIFVLSQRDDKAATDKLMSIVNGHDDPELRKKALFWLSQKDDPAVTKTITDLVTRP